MDPLTQKLVDCDRPSLTVVKTVVTDDHTVELSDQAVDKHFIVEGWPKVLSGVAFIPNSTAEEIASIIDFGTIVEAGEITLFFGNINIREFRQ